MEKPTRREALLTVIAPVLTLAGERYFRDDTVPLAYHEKVLDRAAVQHSQDLQAQFSRHLEAYRIWLEEGCQ